MKFFIGFFTILCLLFVGWVALVFFQTKNPTISSQWIYDVYEKKIVIAKSIKENKVVIVAGSNGLFGIDSKVMSETLNMPVVNLSVNAGVMLPYTLYKSKSVLKSGDTILLPLEYAMYNYDGIPNAQMIDYVFSRDFDAFFELSLLEQFYMIWNITFKRLYDGYFNASSTNNAKGLYGAHKIDSYGDQIETNAKYKTQDTINELNSFQAKKYGEEFNSKSLGWKYIADFIFWCKIKNIKCIFTPSTLMRFDSYFTDKNEKWFYENIGNIIIKQGGTFIGNPYDYMYEKEFYFNTVYHLTEEGRERRTKQLLADIKNH